MAFAIPIDTARAQLFCLSGAPSSGKSSLLHKLAEHYYTIPEAATDIIKEWSAKGIDNPACAPGFEEEVVKVQAARKRTFLDSGHPLGFVERCEIDPFVYGRFFSREPAEPVVEAYKAVASGEDAIYHRRAFMTDLLDVFEENAVRAQENGHPEFVTGLDKALYKGYVKAGFTVVRVPKEAVEPRSETKEDRALAIEQSVTKRANFVLAQCGLPSIAG